MTQHFKIVLVVIGLCGAGIGAVEAAEGNPFATPPRMGERVIRTPGAPQKPSKRQRIEEGNEENVSRGAILIGAINQNVALMNNEQLTIEQRAGFARLAKNHIDDARSDMASGHLRSTQALQDRLNEIEDYVALFGALYEQPVL